MRDEIMEALSVALKSETKNEIIVQGDCIVVKLNGDKEAVIKVKGE